MSCIFLKLPDFDTTSVVKRKQLITSNNNYYIYVQLLHFRQSSGVKHTYPDINCKLSSNIKWTSLAPARGSDNSIDKKHKCFTITCKLGTWNLHASKWPRKYFVWWNINNHAPTFLTHKLRISPRYPMSVYNSWVLLRQVYCVLVVCVCESPRCRWSCWHKLIIRFTIRQINHFNVS